MVMGRQDEKVRTSGDRDDSGGYMILATIEGGVYTRSVKRKSMMFYFVYLLSTISVLIHRSTHNPGLFTERYRDEKPAVSTKNT